MLSMEVTSFLGYWRTPGNDAADVFDFRISCTGMFKRMGKRCLAGIWNHSLKNVFKGRCSTVRSALLMLSIKWRSSVKIVLEGCRTSKPV